MYSSFIISQNPFCETTGEIKLKKSLIFLFFLLAFSVNAFANICEQPTQVWMELTCKNQEYEEKIKQQIKFLENDLRKKRLTEVLKHFQATQKYWNLYMENVCELTRDFVANTFKEKEKFDKTNKSQTPLADGILKGETINNSGLICYMRMQKKRLEILQGHSEILKTGNFDILYELSEKY